MKKFVLKPLLYLFIVLIIISLGLLATGNGYLLKGISCTYLRGYTTAHIYDLEYFHSRAVKNDIPQPWKESSKMNSVKFTPEEMSAHEKFQSVAYVLIENDEIIFENYWEPHNETAVSNSFSMVKSVTALLVGIAHDEGLINSLDDKACQYIPELCNVSSENNEITIRDLLRMTSTINFDESYGDPFGFMARTTYGSDLSEVVYDGYYAEKEPGSEWHYLGGNTLLLGFIVENVTGRNLSDYLAEKIWMKIGAEHPAEWALDKEGGKEKSYCCFNATARDFARLGKLLLNNGKWENQQIVDSVFVAEMTSPLTVPAYDGTGMADHYGYQIWLDEQDGEKIINYRGMLGQYISIIPARDLIMVRLGHARGERDNHCPSDLKEWIKMSKRISSEI